MFKTVNRIICAFLTLILLCGCSSQKSAEENDKIKVVTTVFPLYDFVRAAGGDRVEITLLIKPGTEVHSYDPVPSDIKAVYDSDLFFYIGGESEKWVDKMLSDTRVNSYSLMDYTDNISEDGEDEYDEHVWTSPANAVKMLSAICDSLCKTDPQGEKYYRENTASYTKEINALSDETAKAVNDAEDPFILVADRFPFKYFANYYGLSYAAAMDGCATSSDISLKTMQSLVNRVKEHNLKYAFYIEMSNRKIADALSEQTGVELLELHSAHNVTLDDFKDGITYTDIMNRNLAALREALS